ncbi:SDR family NAD(P)-dependent oxidoreductase [Agromyces soli]|uniref:SDR family oxidoreductase n=1 Tax=Agromyces soli TaxID=659012 RepID=A0ABY4AVF3_9MICO|nr:SDR family oxidoreductase [Agromyces soli]UOE27158.1 SDR family oxidoreductase [Agromyces soli]
MNPRQPASRHIVVTGGASGIGRATAEALLRDSVSVTVMDIDRNAWERSGLADLGARFAAVDVSDETSVEGAFEQAADGFDRLDGVVHCAGVVLDTSTDIRDTDPAVWRRVIDINLTGSFLVARASARRMHRGVIVLIGSQGGVTMPAGTLPYGASKGGLQGLAMTLAGDAALPGIRVINVMPASVDTPLLRAVATAAGVPLETALATTHSAGAVGESIAMLLRDEAAAVANPVLTV